MSTSCESRRGGIYHPEPCEFWNGKNCTDEIQYVNKNTGELMCRYNDDAILEIEYRYRDRSRDELIAELDRLSHPPTEGMSTEA